MAANHRVPDEYFIGLHDAQMIANHESSFGHTEFCMESPTYSRFIATLFGPDRICLCDPEMDDEESPPLARSPLGGGGIFRLTVSERCERFERHSYC